MVELFFVVVGRENGNYPVRIQERQAHWRQPGHTLEALQLINSLWIFLVRTFIAPLEIQPA
ncbi:MAG: hypothetical protein ACI9BW_000034 [Gammaproteobacteria bacterium]|jgi:hypothetical protein